MKKITLITAILVFSSLCCFAQEPPAVQLPKPVNPPISVEAFAGTKYCTFQNFVSKKFSPGSAWGVYHIATYNANYQSPLYNTMVIQSIVNREIYKGLTGGLGAYMSTTGFHPIAALQYTYAGKTFFTTILPTVNWSSNNYQSLLMIFQYRPAIAKSVKLYSRLQIYNSSTSFETRTYSYEQVRLGIEVKTFQIGFGVTFEQLQGEYNFSNANVGFFVRKELFN